MLQVASGFVVSPYHPGAAAAHASCDIPHRKQKDGTASSSAFSVQQNGTTAFARETWLLPLHTNELQQLLRSLRDFVAWNGTSGRSVVTGCSIARRYNRWLWLAVGSYAR